MRILLVEDDVRMSEYLRSALEHQSIAVDVAHDGEAALSLGTQGSFDVIVLDVMMPKMTGFEVCKGIRDHGVSTPVIFLTARSDVEDRIEGLDSGADDYLAKPFSLGELQARIRAVLRRRQQIPKNRIIFDDLVVDLDQRNATRAGEIIDLSPKEFRILEYFVRHRGKVLSRFDILENVWGGGVNMFSNVVDVHISRLRSKLNRGTQKGLIQTVHGGGYVLR